MKGRHFLTLLDYTKEEIEHLLDLAIKMKKGEVKKDLKGKSLAMLFQKSSTRTRVSFEVGMTQLEGHALFMDMGTTQLGRGETIGDTAQTLSRYVDGIMARLYKHSDAEELAKHATVPVINALTDLYHPCQTMADMMTVMEKKGKIAGLKVVFFGDCGFNMFNSTAIGFSKMGADVVACCPDHPNYSLNEKVMEKAREGATGKISVEHGPMEAAEGADIIMTDTWVSMGQDSEKAKRLQELRPYQVDARIMAKAKPDAIFMHCLPAHRGEEMSADVIDGKQSVVFDEAENRLHAQKAIMAELMG
ncbi:MAG TPA: ornithine carbamoyltransferase [Candidatus Bilamarchaeaceae archaeon]|nr:ornithine carbamoyltransferase [Candidatus Bilamarchaeaceae archaeon]